MRRQPLSEKDICNTYIHKGEYIKMYIKILQTTNRQMIQWKKLQKTWNRHFATENIHMDNKHIKQKLNLSLQGNAI